MARWTRLESRKDFKSASDRVDQLIDIDPTESEHNELMLLFYLIEEYEKKHYPMPDAPINKVIRFMLEMKELKQKDLIPTLGSKGNVSKILSGKAKLQLEDVHPLSTLLGIPAEALIPKSESEYAEIGVIAEYVDPVTLLMKESDSSIPMAMEEDIDWGISIKKKEDSGKRKSKVKS